MYSPNCDQKDVSAKLKVSHTVSTSNFASNVHLQCNSSTNTNNFNNSFDNRIKDFYSHDDETNDIFDTEEGNHRYNYKDIKSYYHLTSSPLDLSTKHCKNNHINFRKFLDAPDSPFSEKNINVNNNNGSINVKNNNNESINVNNNNGSINLKNNINNKNNDQYCFADNDDGFSKTNLEDILLNNYNNYKNNYSNIDSNRRNKDTTVLYKANKDGTFEPVYLDTQLFNHFNNINNITVDNHFLCLLNQQSILSSPICHQQSAFQQRILDKNPHLNQINCQKLYNIQYNKNKLTQNSNIVSDIHQTQAASALSSPLLFHQTVSFVTHSIAENTKIKTTQMDPNDSDQPFNFKLQQQQQGNIQEEKEESIQGNKAKAQTEAQQNKGTHVCTHHQQSNYADTQDETHQDQSQPFQAEKLTGMTFTIDFTEGHSPNITHNWTKLRPSKVHSGIQERQEEQRKKRESRQVQRGERMRKSRSHSSYMCEGVGHDGGSHCSEVINVRKSSKFTSPKRLPKSKINSQTYLKNYSKSSSKQPIKSAPPTKHPVIGREAINEKAKKKSKEEVMRKDEEMLKKLDGGVEGTAYLIKKMLQGMNTTSDLPADELASPSISQRLKMGISNSNKAPSDTGTYTIDDEEEASEQSACHGEVHDDKKKDSFYKVPVIDAVEKSAKITKADEENDLPANYLKIKKEMGELVEKSKAEDSNENSCVSPCDTDVHIERDDSFEKLMNETSTRLNALIDATSRVIRDVKGSKDVDYKLSPKKYAEKMSTLGAGKTDDCDKMSFFVVACDTPASRKTLSIAADDAGLLNKEVGKSGKSADVKSPEEGRISEASFIDKKDFSLLQKASQTPLDINTTQSTQEPSQQKSKKQRYIYNKFVPPVAKSLSNLKSASPSSSSSNRTFTRDADRTFKRSGSGRGMSVFSNPPKPNKAFLLRTSQVAEPVKTQAQVLQKKDRSKSVGSHHKLEIKSAKQTFGNNVDSKPHPQPKPFKRPVSPVSDYTSSRRYSVSSSASKNAATPRGTPRVSNKEASRLSRNESGRYSLRADKSSISSIPSSFSSTSTNLGETAWQRRKNYDARKFSTSSYNSKTSVNKTVSNFDRTRDSSRESRGGGEVTRVRSGTKESSESRKREGVRRSSGKSMERGGVKRGEKVNKIAEMSHAVADNLHALTFNNHLDTAATLKMLPLFCHESPQSAFSHQIITKKRNKSENLHSVSRDSNSYDSVLVDSIQQVSKKVKSLADKLIGKMKDDVAPNCTTPCDLDFWHKTSPELSTILHNLCKTEQHLQEVNKALSSEVTSCSQGPLAISPHLARKAGFIPIKKDTMEEEVFGVVDDKTFTRHASKHLLSLKSEDASMAGTSSAFQVVSSKINNIDDRKIASENPLHGDEYY